MCWCSPLKAVCHFYVGEVVSSLQKATLIPGGSEALVYSTLSGSLGVLIPFASKDAYSFFQHLELHMRTENISLVGRDHLHYRSLYYPCKVRHLSSPRSVLPLRQHD